MITIDYIQGYYAIMNGRTEIGTLSLNMERKYAFFLNSTPNIVLTEESMAAIYDKLAFLNKMQCNCTCNCKKCQNIKN